MKEKCLSRSKNSLIKVDKTNEDGSEIKCIAGDIQQHLSKGETHEMNQELLGLRIFFRRIVVINWKGNEINKSLCFKHNKLIIRKSALFYHKFWINRWKKLYDEREQQKRLKQLCKNA